MVGADFSSYLSYWIFCPTENMIPSLFPPDVQFRTSKSTWRLKRISLLPWKQQFVLITDVSEPKIGLNVLVNCGEMLLLWWHPSLVSRQCSYKAGRCWPQAEPLRPSGLTLFLLIIRLVTYNNRGKLSKLVILSADVFTIFMGQRNTSGTVASSSFKQERKRIGGFVLKGKSCSRLCL